MFFAQLHPMIVHFPVALLVSGVVFEFYGTLQKEETALAAGRFNIRLGLACALFAGGIGLAALLSGLDMKESAKPFVGYHLTAAVVTFILFGAAVGIARWRGSRTGTRTVYLTLILLGLFAVLSTGYFGGELVHRFGVAATQ